MDGHACMARHAFEGPESRFTDMQGGTSAKGVRRPNLILTGMPSAGKSTLGVLAAKMLGMDFIDTDILLQSRLGERLQPYIDRHGRAAFLEREEEAVLAFAGQGTVVATGGSVVYSETAMAHLRTSGLVVYIEVPLPELARRLGDAAARGIAVRPGQTLAELYGERCPLYERHADVTIRWTAGDSMADMMARLREGIGWENCSMA